MKKIEDIKSNNLNNMKDKNFSYYNSMKKESNKNFDNFIFNPSEKIKDNKINNDNLNKILYEKKSKQPHLNDSEIKILKNEKYINNTKKSKINWYLFFAFSVVIVFILYFTFNFFETTKILIDNREDVFTLNNKKFTLSKNSNSGIPFEIMIVEGDDYKNINLTEMSEVSIKSKGEVIFYNQYSQKDEKLIKGTRISDEKGILYTLDEDIIIPGYTTDPNGEIIPGSVLTTATSFIAGDSYNGSPKNFKINSFKDTVKYDKIYAQAKTDFTGGISGNVYILNSENLGILNSYKESTFKNNLIRKMKAQVPDGYVFYGTAITFYPSTNENFYFKDSNAKVPVFGRLASVLIKKDYLEDSIIKNLIPGISEQELSEIEIMGIDDLSFKFSNENELIEKDINDVVFNLSGSLQFIWNPKTDILAKSLMGVNKDEVVSILKKDPGIRNATAKIFPPWSKDLPYNISRIKIKVN